MRHAAADRSREACHIETTMDQPGGFAAGTLAPGGHGFQAPDVPIHAAIAQESGMDAASRPPARWSNNPIARERSSNVRRPGPPGCQHAGGAARDHRGRRESMKIQARNVVRFRLGTAMLAANRGEPAEVLNQSSTFSPVTAATSSADSRSWRPSGRSCATFPAWPTASHTCYGTRRFRCRGTSRRRSARSASGARPATFLASHKKGGTS